MRFKYHGLLLAVLAFTAHAQGLDEILHRNSEALGGTDAWSQIENMRVFDAFVPFIASGIAVWAIATYSLTEERAHEIRQQLEARRGKV